MKRELTVEDGTDFVFQLIPSHTRDERVGRVQAWINGKEAFVYRGDWGYYDHSYSDTNFMTIMLGIYRHREDTRQLIYVDNVHFSSTYASVTAE